MNEQVLRDEQVRTRRFREAWETQGVELQALRERVAALEAKACAALPGPGKTLGRRAETTKQAESSTAASSSVAP